MKTQNRKRQPDWMNGKNSGVQDAAKKEEEMKKRDFPVFGRKSEMPGQKSRTFPNQFDVDYDADKDPYYQKRKLPHAEMTREQIQKALRIKAKGFMLKVFKKDEAGSKRLGLKH